MSAAPSPADNASTAAHRNTSALKTSPSRRIARYSQKSERSSACFRLSDTSYLLAIFRQEFAETLGCCRLEQHFGRALFLDHSVMQENDPVRDLASEGHLVRHHDHRRAIGGELAHDAQHLVG